MKQLGGYFWGVMPEVQVIIQESQVLQSGLWVFLLFFVLLHRTKIREQRGIFLQGATPTLLVREEGLQESLPHQGFGGLMSLA